MAPSLTEPRPTERKSSAASLPANNYFMSGGQNEASQSPLMSLPLPNRSPRVSLFSFAAEGQ